MEPLARRHWLVIPDLRGCGRSRNLPPPYSVKQQAADLAALLDYLGMASTNALGYSQGGPVVQELALDYPAKVHRLILSNTYAYNMATMKEKMEGHIVPLLVRLLGVRLFVKLMISQGLKQIPKERAAWVADIIARAWGEADPKSIPLWHRRIEACRNSGCGSCAHAAHPDEWLEKVSEFLDS
jgi:pimeloyl-ACP methyl ester carboxylesterase